MMQPCCQPQYFPLPCEATASRGEGAARQARLPFTRTRPTNSACVHVNLLLPGCFEPVWMDAAERGEVLRQRVGRRSSRKRVSGVDAATGPRLADQRETKAGESLRAAWLRRRRWQTRRWRRPCIHLHAFRWKTDQRNYRRLQLTTTSLEWDLLVVGLVSFAGGARREKKKSIFKCSLFSLQCKCQKIDFTVVIKSWHKSVQ